MKRNYKNYDVLGEAHRIASDLYRNSEATGDSVAYDTVRWLLGDRLPKGMDVHVDTCYSATAKYTIIERSY